MISRRALLGSALGVAAGSTLVGGARAEAIERIDDTERPFGSAVVIGDSLSNNWTRGLAAEMVAHDFGPFRTETRGNRSINQRRRPFDTGRQVVDRLRAVGFDPAVWVIALGGNDFRDFQRGRLDPATEIGTMLDQIGDRGVAWPTIYHRASKAMSATFNEALLAVASRRPNLYVEESWAPLLQANQRLWFKPDGIHLKGPALGARNRMLADAARAVAIRL